MNFIFHAYRSANNYDEYIGAIVVAHTKQEAIELIDEHGNDWDLDNIGIPNNEYDKPQLIEKYFFSG